MVPAVRLLGKSVGDRPHTRHVEQPSFPRVVVGFVAARFVVGIFAGTLNPPSDDGPFSHTFHANNESFRSGCCGGCRVTNLLAFLRGANR